MHEENFLSWLREDAEGKEEERERLNEEAEQETKSGKERGGGTGKVLRSKEGAWIVCLAKFSTCSDCDWWSVRWFALIRNVILLSRRSLLLQRTRSVFGGKPSKFVFRRSASVSTAGNQKKQKSCTAHSAAKAALDGMSLQTRTAWPGPPQESPAEGTTMEVQDQACYTCGMEYGGEHRWTARDRTVMARVDQCLNESDN